MFNLKTWPWKRNASARARVSARIARRLYIVRKILNRRRKIIHGEHSNNILKSQATQKKCSISYDHRNAEKSQTFVFETHCKNDPSKKNNRLLLLLLFRNRQIRLLILQYFLWRRRRRNCNLKGMVTVSQIFTNFIKFEKFFFFTF